MRGTFFTRISKLYYIISVIHYGKRSCRLKTMEYRFIGRGTHNGCKIITRSRCAIYEIRIAFAGFNIGDSIVSSPLGPDENGFGNVSLKCIADENKSKINTLQP